MARLPDELAGQLWREIETIEEGARMWPEIETRVLASDRFVNAKGLTDVFTDLLH